MKLNVGKITSVTLLTSMVLTTVVPPLMPAISYAAETEMETSQSMTEMETESLTEAIQVYASAPETEEDLEEEAIMLIAANSLEEETADVSETTTEKETALQEIQTESVTEADTEIGTEAATEAETPVTEKEEKQTEASQKETEKKKEEHKSSDKGSEKETSIETDHETESMTEEKETDPIDVKLFQENSEVVPEGKNPKEAGYPQKLKLTVTNPTEEDALLHMYFWDYEGEETDGRNIPEEVLTDCCKDILIPSCGETHSFPAILMSESGEEMYETVWLQSQWMNNEMMAHYLELHIPAGCMYTDSIVLLSNEAEKMVVEPVVFSDGEELKFDNCLFTWEEKPVKETETAILSEEETETVTEAETVEMSEEEVMTELTDIEGEEDGTKEETELVEESTEIQETETIEEELDQEMEETETNQSDEIDIPSELKEEDFASKTLLVMMSDQKKIREDDIVTENYGDIYVIEYETVKDCMAAYVYYEGVADAVEPDAFMEIASDKNEEDSDDTALSVKESAAVRSDGQVRLIALLDTGVSASANVVERVSLIDEALEGHSHGNAMVTAITSQNPDAQIMSIRVMGNDGRGTVSSIIEGMEYAMDHGASIINLSLSAKMNQSNAVIEAEIQKAASMGIMVVGAAGNNGADVMNYMPGSVEEAYIIGACNNSGVRIASSNYGTTVDYNVIAGTTSEAAAKFSGLVSLAGVNALKTNEGILYTTDYVAGTSGEVTQPEETEETTDLTEEELQDMAGEEEDGIYPAKGSSVSKKVKLWTRDTDFDFLSYNPYSEDGNVAVECLGEFPEMTGNAGEKIMMEYSCSLKNEENYKWFLYVTFVLTEDRSIATEGSDLLDRLMPECINQERNAGYGGIVPEMMGATVAGREYTVVKGDPDFDIYGLLIDYNPETFKVNDLASDGGFDVNNAGTYTVVYEMSYFLYPEYTWFVANKVNVVEELEAGVYLKTTESTLMFKHETDNNYFGYGDLVKMEAPEDSVIIRCIDAEYEMDVTSSSENVTADICSITDMENGEKTMTVHVPDSISEAVILSIYRPGYQSAKFFTGGGWADGEVYNVEEHSVEQLTDEDLDRLEDTVLGKVDEDSDEYMEIAASWTNVETKNISGVVKTGSANTTNHSWSIGSAGGCNYGTAQITAKKNDITSWISDKGYNMDPGDLSNFKVSCSSGHDYLGLWPNRSYNVTFKCYIQKSGDNYRLKITCSLHPGSDSHGNYQSFYGSKTYSSVTNGAKLRVYKRFKDPAFMDEAPDRYGYLKTTFSIYPASAYNKTTKILDTTVEPEGTIVLSDDEDDTVYGDSDILDPGTYYVVESRRIGGCTQNTDIYGPVVIKDDDSGVVKLHERVNNADYPSMGSNNWIYNDPMYFNGKILTKTDDSGLPVEGAIYKVQYSYAKTVEEFSAKKTWYFKTDASGNLAYDQAHYVSSFSYGGKTYTSDALIMNAGKTVAMLPFGFLKIKEVMPPSEIYEVDANTYTIELAAQKDAAGAYTIRKLAVKGNIPTSIDKLRYWKLTVEKQSKASPDILELNSYSLAGATFSVYTDQACTKLAQLYSDDKLTNKVTNNVFKTDENGKTPTYYLQAGSGTTTYYVKEQTAPSGHQVCSNPLAVAVTMPADALKLKTASFTGEYSEPYDTMELDTLTDKLSMKGNGIEGVVFKVCFYDDTKINAARLKKTWYLASDKEGKVKLDTAHLYTKDASLKSDPFYTDPESKSVILPIGGYVSIQEVKAPAQYVIDDTVQGFVTKKGKVATTKTYNELTPCRIRLKKCDVTGKRALQGVQFELKFVKATETDTTLKKTYTRLLKEGETKILTTDKNGEITFDNLDQGTYEITEVKTVAGQTLLKEKIKVELPITMTKAEAEKYGNVDFKSAKEDKGYTDKWFFYDCLYQITNEPQFKVPQTGGFGDWKWGYIGFAVLLIAGGILVTGRKRRYAFQVNKVL